MWAVILFVSSETMFFGALFTTYFYLRRRGVLHADRVPRRARDRRGAHEPLCVHPHAQGTVHPEPTPGRRGSVDLLALRRRGLDRPLLHHLHPGIARTVPLRGPVPAVLPM